MEVFQTLVERIKENKPTVLVTVTKTKGSTPGRVGFKLLVDNEGRTTGTIGGGPVEFHAIEKCKEFFNGAISSSYEVIQLVDRENPETDNSNPNFTKLLLPAWCGGELELFYELISNKKTIYIFGAGHIGEAVASLAAQQEFFPELFDNRKDVLDQMPDFSGRKHLIEYPPAPFQFELNENSFAVLVTQCYKFDLPILELLLTQYPKMKYIGMIGSKLKVKKCIHYLNEKYGSKLSYHNLYAPIGIDIGGNTPGEIAISIMAEIMAVINNKEAPHLRLNYHTIKNPDSQTVIKNETSIYN